METETISSGAPEDATYDTVAAFPQAFQPTQIGRYRIERLLGQGGFGSVYLAHDDQLQRLVAVKVPHFGRSSGREHAATLSAETRSSGVPVVSGVMRGPGDPAAYLAEARAAAGLDHPNIVPVYDFGSTIDCPCFIVSKYIEGSPLTERLRFNRPSLAESAELVATIAGALHHAHGKRLIHRDVKPGNILIDATRTPFLTDFGMALKDENIGKGFRYAGTPAYMSPEQARGEGHRVDGRSDIFSLGVVFYELLTGLRPFSGGSITEVLEQIRSCEPRPPRQHEEAICKELERICMKALAKRASERYGTAKELAEDLRHWIGSQDAVTAQPGSSEASLRPSGVGTGDSSKAMTSLPATPVPRAHIVPKGLRSFDAHDSDFFLELLPGPRDREGLPDSIRFWKTRIEETDPDQSFAVGLIYGPSGCGKSSLVKAGLLPRLSGEVITAYVEATAGETEARLLNGLRKRVPALPPNLNLTATLAALRRGQCVPAGKKVLIVLDQFEQWLHARKDEHDTELVQALRQCDASHVRCVVMVRDDFWMAATLFMRDLEICLLEGQNSAAVHLFDTSHARKVLAAFGQAFGTLPENLLETTPDVTQFLNLAVTGLAQEGKVVSVRLALFAEMMKGRSWTPVSLEEVGGTEGVGVTFLEETFSASTAPPEHRYHQKAARSVLKCLLPESGTDIRRHMRSHAELLDASGYVNPPKDFDDLIRILDSEVRLLTPTDPEGKDGADESTAQAEPGNKYYQLTHDYLVPALRDWLTRKQKETRRGRAELLLADRAGVWNARPENRQLPSLRQWLDISFLTRKKTWSPPQRKMMNRATRHHARRGVAVALALAMAMIASLTIRRQQKATQAAGLVKRLIDADTPNVPADIAALAGYRSWADPLLRDENSGAAETSRQKLHSSLGLLPVDPSQVDFLYRRLLTADPNELPIIRDALQPYKDSLIGKLWPVVQTPERGRESTRLRAAAALAKYVPGDAKWAECSPAVTADLVRESPVFFAQWSEAFRTVRHHLRAALKSVFEDTESEHAAERNQATNLLAVYFAEDPMVLADLLMDAGEKQFAVIYPAFVAQAEKGLPELIGEVDRPLTDVAKDEDKEKLAKRQANAAVALLRLNQPAKVWPILRHSKDPRARSYLIHRFSPLGVDPEILIQRFEQEPDITIRRALILSLGEFDQKQWRLPERAALTGELLALCEKDPDPGLHAAAEWLLRQWGQDAKLNAIDAGLRTTEAQLHKALAGSRPAPAIESAPPRWYVNGQGQTMVVVSGPVWFTMGSPLTEANRREYETPHKVRIGRTFAVAARPVTVGEYARFAENPGVPAEYTDRPDLPVVGVDWYSAAAYCNWLSRKEGIPENQWCYQSVSTGKARLKEGYLGLEGYRLPTEAEMEFATRAGASTSRYYGETDELLPSYAWYLANAQEKTWPVGSKKPNDLGLFDVQGNVFCWCQEAYIDYPNIKEGDAVDDEERDLDVISTVGRVLRGCSFTYPASYVRCAQRSNVVPTGRDFGDGFRPARTIRFDRRTTSPPASNSENLLSEARAEAAAGRSVAAAARFAAAFAADPKLAESPAEADALIDAARAAAQAVAGIGSDAANLGDADRTGWRVQALEWLKTDLAVRARQIDAGDADARIAAIAALRRMERDPDLAGLRDDEAISRLPPGESAAWYDFWARVQDLHSKAAAKDD